MYDWICYIGTNQDVIFFFWYGRVIREIDVVIDIGDIFYVDICDLHRYLSGVIFYFWSGICDWNWFKVGVTINDGQLGAVWGDNVVVFVGFRNIVIIIGVEVDVVCVGCDVCG